MSRKLPEFDRDLLLAEAARRVNGFQSKLKTDIEAAQQYVDMLRSLLVLVEKHDGLLNLRPSDVTRYEAAAAISAGVVKPGNVRSVLSWVSMVKKVPKPVTGYVALDVSSEIISD